MPPPAVQSLLIWDDSVVHPPVGIPLIKQLTVLGQKVEKKRVKAAPHVP